MYELVKVANNTYYVNCPAKIGVYDKGDGGVILIDSGNDKDAARRVRRVLEEQGWSVETILNTHANADHIGGNKYFQQNLGCRIFAPGIDMAITRHPILEPAFLYGGYPCCDLRHKFLLAQASDAEDVLSPDFPEGFEIIPLPGHFFDMVGYRTPDGVVFLADCVSSPETLQKYQISFIYDVQGYLDTLDMIETLDAPLFVPSHTEPAADIRPLADINRCKVHEIAGKLLNICQTPSNFEAILQRVFSDYALTMSFEQYVLVGSTVRSYLSWLKDSGRLCVSFDENLMLWKTVS